jgi:hypothetical protein
MGIERQADPVVMDWKFGSEETVGREENLLTSDRRLGFQPFRNDSMVYRR